jgi:hypothetical protein
MPNQIDSLQQIDKKLQQYSHMFNDPVICYEEGLVNSILHPLVKDESENECVQQSREIEKYACDNNE